MNYVLLDFDSTITARDTTRYLIRELLWLRPWKVVPVVRLSILAKLGISAARLQHEKNMCIGELIGGLFEEELASVVSRLKGKIVSLFRKRMLEVIDANVERGTHVIVASASPAFLLSAIFDRPGVSVVATQYCCADGRYTRSIVGEPCYGSAKVRAIESVIQGTLGAHEVESAWSDSLSDLPMMMMAAERYWICKPGDVDAIRSADPKGNILSHATTL